MHIFDESYAFDIFNSSHYFDYHSNDISIS